MTGRRVHFAIGVDGYLGGIDEYLARMRRSEALCEVGGGTRSLKLLTTQQHRVTCRRCQARLPKVKVYRALLTLSPGSSPNDRA